MAAVLIVVLKPVFNNLVLSWHLDAMRNTYDGNVDDCCWLPSAAGRLSVRWS